MPEPVQEPQPVCPTCSQPVTAPIKLSWWESLTDAQKAEIYKDALSLLGVVAEVLNLIIPTLKPGIGLTFAVGIRPILNRFCNKGDAQ